mmetsp:Transcript_7855/g.11869  ORF Transcript_7855/g.11869 Transcript_7855/m.11869 type:complete len:204 (-) Transcript_7855:785-1396(-)|eukprot:CAMPEP_0175090632 /NCGR_PEP_ID=MMETSP0086_2-20121207/1458_1 /TAXON_ID=136419 /ORGANISM="Unknown Unknown, Strain D1" /LENGTH=203 /DNA_ID=CAMNT_0016363291 /DNA_START=34 /DNA_END=645 /DNA_ORIENTATION=+
MGMEDELFNLKFTAKQLIRESKRCEKQAVSEKKKCKVAMEKSNMEGARIYAENAIREKNNALNYLRLSSRIDAVAARVNTAVRMQNVTKSMSGIVKSMGSVMKSMNPEKISEVMDKFEKQFEDLDVSSKVMESSMSESTAQTMPESQVDSLMSEVAEEHNLEFVSQIEEAPSAAKKKQVAPAEEKKMSEEDLLEERLKKLQGL